MHVVSTTLSFLRSICTVVNFIWILTIIVIFGWASGYLGLASLLPYQYPINPTMIIVFAVLLTCFVVSIRSGLTQLQKKIVLVLLGVIILICIARTIDAILGNPFNIDALLFHNKVLDPTILRARFSRTSAILCILAAVITLLAQTEFKRKKILLNLLFSSSILILSISSIFAAGRDVIFLVVPAYFSASPQMCILFLLLFALQLQHLRHTLQLKLFIQQGKFISLVCFLMIPFWVFYITPELRRIPRNFSYTSEVESVDNFYNEQTQQYSGEQRSNTTFSYKVDRFVGNTLIIKNIFDVKTLDDKPIFAVSRLYGIDSYTGSHKSGYGDHDREGFLFAPKELTKQDFTYWHVNYDVPAQMKFVSEEQLFGLDVYRYAADLYADQTQNLTHLPQVGQTRGIDLDAHITLWVEPHTGRLIKYQDDTIAYFYDLATKQRLFPWNHFHNGYTTTATRVQVLAAQRELASLYMIQTIIPAFLFALAIGVTVFFFIFEYSRLQFSSYVPLVVCLVGIATTFLIYQTVQRAETQKNQLRFESDSEDIVSSISEQLHIYENVLHGARGLFRSSSSVERAEWKSYIDSLQLPLDYPGIQGVGFAEFISPDKKSEYEKQIQAEGFADFHIRPEGDRPVYSSITFIEPFDTRNQRAFGFDMFQEPVRRAAMIKARDENTTQLSAKVTLVQEITTDIQPGFLMYLPYYKKDLPLETVEQRQAAILGYIYSPFRMHDFMKAVLKTYDYSIDTEVFDGRFEDFDSEEAEVAELYDSDVGRYSRSDTFQARFATTRQISAYGRTWTIRFLALPGYEENKDQVQLTQITVFAGAVITTLLTVMVYSLTSSRNRAVQLAETMTKDLRTQTQELQKFQLAVDHANDQIVISDNEGKIIYGNPAVERLTGWKALEILGEKAGKRWGGLMSPQFYADMWRTISTEKKTFTGELRNQRKNGEQYTAQISISPIIDEQGLVQFFVAIERDISLEKDEKLRLERQKQKDDALLGSIGEGLVATDATGKIIIINDAFEGVLGWTAEDVMGKRLAEIVDIYDTSMRRLSVEQRPLTQVLTQKEKLSVSNYYYSHKDGHKVPIAITVTPLIIDGKLEGAIEVFRDITHEIEEKQKIQEAEQNLEQAQKIGNFGSFVWNLQTNAVEWSDESFYIHDFTPSESHTPPPLDEYFAKIHPDDREAAKASMTTATSQDEENSHLYRVIWKDKSTHWVRVRSQLYKDDAGKPFSLKGTFQDITKEKVVDQMKTEFISLASHQLRTPLTAIKWIGGMLLTGDGGELPQEAKTYVQNIVDSNERMIELVNSLLNISRIESGRLIVEPVPTKLSEIVTPLLAELQSKIQEKRHTVTLENDDSIPAISVDPKLLRQVYQNFLTNAIKYTPDQGKITIRIERKGESIVSMIQDNGYGIPKNEQGRVFDKFYRGENIIPVETDGNGLGLYLVKSIIEASNGKVWFESHTAADSDDKSSGTTFWFSLPLSGSTPHKGEVRIDS